ncbi:50S ribosomal protein L28 [bacterium]|nr:50S ribosomal protein L28 [bacterium]
MSRVCEVCGKGALRGHQISHSHKISSRRYEVNLQSVKVRKGNKIETILVCAKCLKAGKVARV